MVGLFYIYLPMSWSIPTQIELDIIAGKAVYQTFQTGNGGQSILPVPPNSYAVIFGYDFSPAGGGFTEQNIINADASLGQLHSSVMRYLETQQISFYTGTDFFPFIHHVNVEVASIVKETDSSNPVLPVTTRQLQILSIDNTPLSRQVYITANNDVTITHGMILNSPRATANAIPVTNRTPIGLTYGGSPQVINTQTNYGPGATPLQFMQPSPKDFQDFAFGLLPGNADNQAFATPDITNGLRDVTQLLVGLLGGDPASYNYYLCIHYALYSKTIPEQRG